MWESQPAWSPDSRSIVFVHNETSVDIDDDELYRINVDARRLVRLTHNKLTDRFPVWLRDGSIAFWRYPYNRLIDRGRQEHALAGPGYTSWSPDGSRMAIGRYKGGLAIVRRRGRAPQKIVGRGVADVAWSPDGSRIAFVSTSGISVVHPDGTGRRLVTDGGASDYEVVMDPVWSPDGSLIAFVLVNSSVPDWVHGLYIVRAAGGGLRRLKIPIREQAVSYAWSPDSRHLVIGGNQVDLSRAFPASPYPLILVDVQSSEMKRLTQTGKS